MDEQVVVALPRWNWLINDGEFLSFRDKDGNVTEMGTVWEFIDKLTGESNGE